MNDPLGGGGSQLGLATQQAVTGSPVRLQNLNLLTAGGQQFVIASPVSVPSLQQVQRVVSVSPRGNVGQISGSGANMLAAVGGTSSCSRAAAHPTLVTSLASPVRQTQVLPSTSIPNPRKRARPQDITMPADPVKRRILDAKLAKVAALRSRYAECVAELYFLQGNGCLVDYPTWRNRRSAPHHLQSFLQSNRLDPDDPEEDLSAVLTPVEPETPDVSSPRPIAAASPDTRTTQGQTIARGGVEKKSPSKVLNPPFRQHPSSTLGEPPVSPIDIIDQARKEASVLQRVAELQKEGLWSDKRLPKVQEPSRGKAHWDYLLEEMIWLAADFNQERKWKKANAKKCARMVHKYFIDKEMLQKKEEKSQELKLRRLANFIAKEIKNFWAGVNKLVEFKQTTRLEEKRKKAMDQHLNFIVGETEKYSTWLTESMNKGTASTNCSRVPSPNPHGSDEEFQPNITSSDDEETIAKEEESDDKENNADEIERLKRESEIPLEDLINQLPDDYLRDRDKLVDPGGRQDADEEDSGSTKSEDFTVDSGKETSDDEATLEEQENAEGKQDHATELAELEADNEMSIEQLRAKYSGAPAMEEASTPRDSDEDEQEGEDDEGDASLSETEESMGSQSDVESDSSAEDGVSLKTLVENQLTKDSEGDREQANREINDATAIAESLQPKGSTLLTTNVVTPIPFLLRQILREYQHIGLDWLVTMFDRKLNGILADEMGLGKTIQTIALLAHLACEKSNWGPHLIIVPTSVMLNWEMELKKWCPAFKILTYYGTIKERKAKRSGWTKPNAFHVCITSYKLVIQDHQSFRRKKWQYLVLDEAQNIKNFRSQRWQLLLNFQTQRRLLLTGTPLQNNLLELWSLMHFLMPHVFQSHREFKEWFSNPVSGMLDGNSEYNESIIKRLHKVLRPFLLRRLKTEVEKQLPKKYEHIVMCRLSKRQRYLYDDFMSRAKTKETLASGNLLSVINVLMQLRKVCNHPNLFEVRPVISPFQMAALTFYTASIVTTALEYDPFRHVDLNFLNLVLPDCERMTAYGAYSIQRLRVDRKLIEEMDDSPPIVPRPPRCRLRISVRNCPRKMSLPLSPSPGPESKNASTLAGIAPVKVGTSPLVRLQNHPAPPMRISGSQVHLFPGTKQAGLPVQLVQTSTGRHIYFPLQSAPPSNSVIANGQRLSLGNLKPSSPQPEVTETAPVPTDTTSSSTATTTSVTMTVTRMSPPVNMLVDSPPPLTPPELVVPIQPIVEKRRLYERLDRLQVLGEINHRRCEAYPIYGEDMIEALRLVNRPIVGSVDHVDWRWHGLAHCNRVYHPELWATTEALTRAVRRPEDLLESLRDIISRFIVYVPAATALRPLLHVSHPPPSRLWNDSLSEVQLQQDLAPRCGLLHRIASSMRTQFPDPRLIQYDCGKLQVLDRLLRQLKMEHHKVLLFTQMTRMLDVLEAFLNYHGYIYLRLDGTTRVDQRQVLMERFNGDARIFVFILSTRSGGIGVNLTGADTVIFYDSDWNPTMDAQAQDRCHRIGQTRDVHIYRLISEMTIEENILKKANQKRLLGDIAIEGGNFTTAYFKNQSTIQDLFNVDTSETDATKRMRQGLVNEREKRTDEAEPTSAEKAALGALESALATAEDAPDVEAARTATAEAAAELAEFDESIPLDDAPEPAEPEMSKAEMEVELLVQQLKPIERYAMRFVEENEAAWSAEQLAAAEKQIEEQKREWELNRQAALQAEEERLREEAEDESYVYHREDVTNKLWVCSRTIEAMPIWCPPTPPQELADVFIDQAMSHLYNEQPVPDSQLPPVYVKKELKRARVTDAPVGIDGRRALKLNRRDDSPLSAPRSLFDHPSSTLQKMRRDVKMHKYRGLVRSGSLSSTSQSRPSTPVVTRDENSPDWSIQEDYILLQTIEKIQELPLGLIVLKPGHTPNWDFVADLVNRVSSTTRSPAQCRNRYEAVIIPREEGKLVHEQKKQKKTKNMYKLPQKGARALRTAQLNAQDNNAAFTDMYHQRFDNIKSLSMSRKPTPKPLLVNPLVKNPKHAAVLAESGIHYDKPLNPIEIATRRADRIAKDKKLQQGSQAQVTQAVTSGTVLAAEQIANQRLIVAAAKAQPVSQTVPTASVNVSVSLANAVVGSTQVLQTITTTAPSSSSQAQSIVVASGTPLQTTGIATLTPGVRPNRPVTAIPVGLQEMVVQATNRTVTSAATTVVSVANLTQAQLQAARLATGNLVSLPASAVKVAGTPVSTVQVAGGQKTLNPAQVNYFRHQTILRQQPTQRINIRDQQAVKVVQGQAKVQQVTAVQPASPSQTKTQYLKQPTPIAKGRQEDVAALVKQQLQRQKTAGVTQSALTAQFLTQGLQVQSATTQVATLVKTSAAGQSVTIPLPSIAIPQVKSNLNSQLKTTVASSQQIRQLGISANYQQLLAKGRVPAKMTQLTKPGVQTQLIVQSQAGKAVSAISMQHIQHVIKNVPSQHITVSGNQAVAAGSQVVLAKSTTTGSTLSPRVLPGTQATRQTIQVVPGSIRTVPNVSQVSVNSSLASALSGTIKVGQPGATSQQTFLSQVTNLPGIVRQAGVNPVRIQTATSSSGTPLMAVTVQQQAGVQQQSPDTQGQS